MMNISSTNYQPKSNFHNKNQSKLAFGRALTTAETNLVSNYLSDGIKKADIETLALNLPVAAAPSSSDNNSGVGNFSNVADFMPEFKNLTGFNAALFLPLSDSYSKYVEMKNDKGEVVKKVRVEAPFSTDAFGLNTGFFDPSKLSTEEYGNLLKQDDAKDKKVLNDLYDSPVKDTEKTQYDNIDKIDAVLNRAYENYKTGLKTGDESIAGLKEEFDNFKAGKTEKYWLDTYAKNKDAGDPERYKFKQFLIKKQHGEMTNKLKDNGISTIIDIPVGANRDLDRKLEKDDPFLNRELGSFDDSQGKWVGWGITSLDPGKQSAKDLAYWKARYHASLGTAVRLDCFNGNMFAADGNGILPEYKANPTALADPLFYGLRDGGTDPNISFAEHLPSPTAPHDKKFVDRHLYNKSKEILGSPIPKLSVEKWAPETYFGPDSFNSNGSHEIPGYHQDRKGNSEAIKEGFVTLLSRGTKKVMLPFTDVFGMDETYNISNTTNDTNWTKRLPEGNSWETKYQEKLQSGYGFNAPEIIAKVLDRKGKNDEEANNLKSVLGKFGQLLRAKDDEIKTQQAANETLGADYIDPELKKLIQK
jgi:4-alpha-glucanotransferase